MAKEIKDLRAQRPATPTASSSSEDGDDEPLDFSNEEEMPESTFDSGNSFEGLKDGEKVDYTYDYSDMGSYTCQGVEWRPILKVDDLSRTDGAYMVAKHPITGHLFAAPCLVDLSKSFKVDARGYYVPEYQPDSTRPPGKAEEKPKATSSAQGPPPPIPPKATKPKTEAPGQAVDKGPEHLISPGVAADKGNKGKARETGDPIQNQMTPLSMYLCPSCDSPRTRNHSSSCPMKNMSWAPLSREGKAERTAYLEHGLTSSKAPSAAPKLAPAGKAEDPKSGAEGKKDPIAKGNPLGVADFKLTEAQEAGLKKFFGLKELPSKPIFDALSKEEQKAARLAAIIPRWSIAAIRHHNDNYQAIVGGKLTLEQFQAGKYKKPVSPPKEFSSVEVTKKWVTLRERFTGTVLLETPRSQKERAFKQAFDKLKSEVGDRNELPKLKQGRQNGQSSTNSRRESREGGSSSEASSLRESLLLFAEIAKIFRS
jgi:hypothetical protein